MLLGFGYIYKFVMSYVLFLFQKAENNRLKEKASWSNIIFSFCLE